MVNGRDDVEIYVPKKEYIPTEEDIYANGWTEEKLLRDLDNDHVIIDTPSSPFGKMTEEENNKRNAIIQERMKRATGSYWSDNKYARLK